MVITFLGAVGHGTDVTIEAGDILLARHEEKRMPEQFGKEFALISGGCQCSFRDGTNGGSLSNISMLRPIMSSNSLGDNS